MIQIGDTAWEVQSDSTDKTYTVNLTSSEGWPTCTCTAFAINRNRAVGRGQTPKNCKHITSVIALGGSQKMAEVKEQKIKEQAKKATSALRDMLADLDDKPKTKPVTPDVVLTVNQVEAEAVLSGTSSMTGDLTVENDVAPEMAAIPNPGTPDSETIVSESDAASGVTSGVIQDEAPTASEVSDVSGVVSTFHFTNDEVAVLYRALSDYEGDPNEHYESLRAKVMALPLEVLAPLDPAGLTLPVTQATPVSAHNCPRCGGQIPNNESPGAYPGALSRTDNTTEVCSQCGTDEAMQQFLDDNLTPQSDWPLVRKYDFPNAKVK